MENEIIIHSDGGSRGNPGPAAIGAVLEINGNIFKLSEKIGEATNNTAEYKAIVEGLKKAKKLLGKTRTKNSKVKCFLDSELIVKQLNREYKIKEVTLHKFFIELWNLTLDFKEVTFTHVKREMNKEADRLVNQALDGA